jgi:hypothetical protein
MKAYIDGAPKKGKAKYFCIVCGFPLRHPQFLYCSKYCKEERHLQIKGITTEDKIDVEDTFEKRKDIPLTAIFNN